MAAGSLHYLLTKNPNASITTSYEMGRLSKRNKEFSVIFENLKKSIWEFSDLKEHIQNQDSLLLHNPKFDYFEFRDKGLVTKKDEVRERMIFTWSFKDAYTSAEGTIQALVIYQPIEKTSYFEKLSVFLSVPEVKTFRVISLSHDLQEKEEVYPKDTPISTQRSRSAQGDLHLKAPFIGRVEGFQPKE